MSGTLALKERLHGTYRVVISVNDTWTGELRIVRTFDTHDITIKSSDDEVELTLKTREE